MARFKARIKDGTERIVFECIAGDFNFDNMSPSEIKYSKHPVFQQYNDVCIKKPGTSNSNCNSNSNSNYYYYNYYYNFNCNYKL